MGVFRMKLAGRTSPVLLRAKSKTDAIAALVEGKALTADEVEEAFGEGATIWKPGDPLPEDAEPEVAADPEPETSVES